MGLILISLLKKLSLKYRFLISKEISLVGGLALAIAFIFATLCGILSLGVPSREIFGIIIASFLMLVFGVIDDWHELSVATKFSVQIIATTLLIFFGIRTQIVYLGYHLNTIITFIWVLAITNAFNHLDIMDGVAATSALIVSMAFLVISFLNGDVKTIILLLALMGAVLSFLIYNLPPARLYMGNAGSHFLGFVLAAIALVISYAPLERKIALISPLLILGFPIYDTFFLVLMRLTKKKHPFKKSNDHLVLRLLAKGYTKKKALSMMLCLNLFFVFLGVLVSQVSNLWGILIITVVILISLGLAIKMSKVVINE
jgi:UDP-GlcNAc:undecaprenyl-phosphate GlcNAc-1-phosphate transferase